MITRALLVGINEYRTQAANVPNLGGCLNDVALVTSVVRSVYSCPADRIVTLTNDQATSANLREAFSAFVSRVSSSERLFFYFSGHGVQVPDLDEDDEDDWDEAFVTHDFSKTAPFLDDELRAFRTRLPRGAKLTMLLDCCHSGGMPRFSGIRGAPIPQARNIEPISRDLYSAPERQQLLRHQRSFNVEAVEENFIALAACEPEEKAWEQTIEHRLNGVFTYAVCNCLKENGPHSSAWQLMENARDRIGSIGSIAQTPRLVGRQAYFDAPLFD